MMDTVEFEKEYGRLAALVEDYLRHCFEGGPARGLAEAMRYSLLAGGKRIRPVIVLAFAEASGGEPEKALPAAAAVEMLHTYSLIHDDLPCMDNDELRRGKPTNHIVYGEWMATLSGDALQAEAFNVLLHSRLPAETVVDMGRTLARAAGLGGICLGQALDMAGEGKALSLGELTEIHRLKTAALLVASAELGVLSGNGGAGGNAADGGAGENAARLEAAARYASALGVAFQIRDDILDLTAATDVLGKPAGSDALNGKTTFATLFGPEECGRLIRQKTAEAVEALAGHFANADFLSSLAINLEERKY